MMVKIVRHGKDGEESETFPCSHLSVKKILEDSVAATTEDPETGGFLALPGIELQLKVGGRETRTLHLPRDGEVAYIMNDEGRTVDTYRWPIAQAGQPVGRGKGGA